MELSRQRKLYVSELLSRCTNKLLKVIVKTKSQTLTYETILIAIQDLKETWLWNYQVIAYTIIDNDIFIVLNK